MVTAAEKVQDAGRVWRFAASEHATRETQQAASVRL